MTFAVDNRGEVDLNLFPLPYTLKTRLFLFTIVVFSAGVLLGWVLGHFKIFRHRSAHKQAARKVAAMENELAALRAEQLARPPAITATSCLVYGQPT